MVNALLSVCQGQAYFWKECTLICKGDALIYSLFAGGAAYFLSSRYGSPLKNVAPLPFAVGSALLTAIVLSTRMGHLHADDPFAHPDSNFNEG